MLPFGAAISDTDPVGVPLPLFAATEMLTFTGWPWTRFCGERLASVVLVAEKLAELQAFTRFAAFTDPKPVARS
jgi:hypothetical protein